MIRYRDRPLQLVDSRSSSTHRSYGWIHYDYHDTGTGYQETWDQENDWYLLKDSGLDIGGPFLSRASFFEQTPDIKDIFVLDEWDGMRYTGPLSILGNESFTRTDFPQDTQASSDDTLDVLGTTAIARTLPMNPGSSSGQFLGELAKDGIPAIIGSGLLKSKTRKAKKIGNEYLNYQFGWAPIVSDLQKFAKSVSQSSKTLKRLERNSGRRVRARFYFPLVEEDPYVMGTFNSFPSHMSNLFSSTVPVTVTRTLTRRRWFSGSFTYYVPMGNSQMDKLTRYEQEANKLLGFRITPKLVWQLAPWSWAADWFGNFGDVMTNISSLGLDSQCLHHGYMMEETIEKYTYDMSGITVVSHEPIHVSQSFGTVVKKRRHATPYGFGLKDVDITPQRWAIIAALGISR